MSLTPSSLQLSAKHAPPHITRPCANFSPSFWGDTFLQYHSAVLYVIFAFPIFYFIHLHTYYLL